MKRYLALILVAILALSVFAGCGDGEKKDEVIDQNNNVVNGEFSEYLVAEKIGHIERDDFMVATGGLYYKDDNGLYGIMTLNGARDTGAKYSSVTPVGNYFEVSNVAVADAYDYEAINSSYLVDSKGDFVVDGGFATFDVLNERYIKVTKVTARTDIKSDVVMSRNAENGLRFDSYYDTYDGYKGAWYVYDTVTGDLVPNATGTTASIVQASGRYITFEDENNNFVKVDEAGEKLVNFTRVYADGSYSFEDEIGEVYSNEGEFLFDYDLDGYVPTELSGEYYTVRKYTDNGTKYAVMNKKGEIVSAEFDEYIILYGELVHCDNKIYKLNGDVVIEGTYAGVTFDKVFGQNWMLRNEGYYTVIDKDGKVFFNGPDDDEYTVFADEFVASKKIDDDSYYYSYKDKDYTIKGYSFAPWIVKSYNDEDDLCDLVDTMTGKKLLEGYENFSSVSRRSDVYYVYAKNDGGTDVYMIVSGAQVQDVINKKNDLYDELAAAFANEGLDVTVNKETGEIALDTSVLFGGDSAELTASGKEFLDKFMKAYTNVAFADEYEGFISKTLVEGHTAPITGSTYESGLPLSRERAANVKDYCLSVDTGVDADEVVLEDVGYSNSQPVYNADGSVNMAASRRVSFRFMVNVEF